MLVIRSRLFAIAFFIITLAEMVLFAPFYFLLPHKQAWIVPRMWARSVLFAQRVIAGTRYHIEGLENLPEGACIVAAKHQSRWETLALVLFIADPTIILKRELMWIPGFGWYLAKMGMVPINRGSPIKALKAIITAARKRVAQGRQILIFPEGTRQVVGAEPDYKPGIVPIYTELELPVVPVAHNAGLYWPPDNFRRYPGTIRCRFLPVIKPGLERKAFMKRLEHDIETASDELLLAAAKGKNPPAMPPKAMEKLKSLGLEWKGKTRL